MAAIPPHPPKGLINGPVYDVAYFSTKYLNVPPNLHRLKNAVGLMAGLYLGRKTMDILTGQTPDGKPVDKEELPPPLRKLHGVLAYDHFSDDPKERWMKVFDLMVPGVLGGVGAAAGSIHFFKDSFFKPINERINLPAEKFTLADAEHRALYHQSKPWGLMSGTSAVFGSASGFGLFPSPLNYSSTLGTTFTMRAGRSMANPVMRNWYNSHSYIPFRPTKLVNRMIDYVAANPGAHPEKLEEYARGIVKTWFNHASEEQIQGFANLIKEQRNQFLKEGRLPQEAEAKVKESLKKMLTDVGVEETLIKVGLDPREAQIGDMGFISTISHMVGNTLGLGTSRHMKETEALMAKGLEARHPELIGKPFTPASLRPKSDASQRAILGAGFVGTGAGVAYMVSTAKDASVKDLDTWQEHSAATASTNQNTDDSPSSFSQRVGSRKHQLHSKKQHNWLNGHALDAAEGVTGMLNAQIGIHRVECALGLTAGSWFGDKVMEALTGVTFDGRKIGKDKVLRPLQGLYKIMPFNPHSDHPNDKWMQVMRWAVPGILGAAAVVEASKFFFAKRHEELKSAVYLDDVEARATDVQSKPWNYSAAVTSLFGYPSGLPMLPLVNYSTNLGTRFSMASGRKVSLPVIGKYWSNNSTLFPFGPPGMLNLLIQTAVHNKSFDPELLETYTIGVLKPWFKDVTPQQVESFVMKIHEVRDKFYQDGGVPEALQAQLEKELNEHFKGAGLEDTLLQIGLDPTKASIGSNGISGEIANAMGAREKINKIKANFISSFRERHQNSSSTSADPALSH